MALNLSRLKYLLHYDPKTGVFTRLKQAGCTKVGDIAGNQGNHGYLQFALDGQMYLAHRVAFFYMTGDWPSRHVDHVNGDKIDNRWSNLREATPSQNSMNTPLHGRNTSGFRGVSWNARRRKWYAFIAAEGKQNYLGSFDELEAARAAYKAEEERLFGQFARAS